MREGRGEKRGRGERRGDSKKMLGRDEGQMGERKGSGRLGRRERGI